MANEVKCLSGQIKTEVAATLDHLQSSVVLRVEAEQTRELEVFEDAVDSEAAPTSQDTQPQPDKVTSTTDVTLDNGSALVEGNLRKRKAGNFFSHEQELQGRHRKIIKDKLDETPETFRLEAEAAAALSLQQLYGLSNAAAAAPQNLEKISLEGKNMVVNAPDDEQEKLQRSHHPKFTRLLEQINHTKENLCQVMNLNGEWVPDSLQEQLKEKLKNLYEICEQKGRNVVVDKNSKDGTRVQSQVTPDTTTVPTKVTNYDSLSTSATVTSSLPAERSSSKSSQLVPPNKQERQCHHGKIRPSMDTIDLTPPTFYSYRNVDPLPPLPNYYAFLHRTVETHPRYNQRDQHHHHKSPPTKGCAQSSRDYKKLYEQLTSILLQDSMNAPPPREYEYYSSSHSPFYPPLSPMEEYECDSPFFYPRSIETHLQTKGVVTQQSHEYEKLSEEVKRLSKQIQNIEEKVINQHDNRSDDGAGVASTQVTSDTTAAPTHVASYDSSTSTQL